mgnify:CR=1 FL=1
MSRRGVSGDGATSISRECTQTRSERRVETLGRGADGGLNGNRGGGKTVRGRDTFRKLMWVDQMVSYKQFKRKRPAPPPCRA